METDVCRKKQSSYQWTFSSFFSSVLSMRPLSVSSLRTCSTGSRCCLMLLISSLVLYVEPGSLMLWPWYLYVSASITRGPFSSTYFLAYSTACKFTSKLSRVFQMQRYPHCLPSIWLFLTLSRRYVQKPESQAAFTKRPTLPCTRTYEVIENTLSLALILSLCEEEPGIVIACMLEDACTCLL